MGGSRGLFGGAITSYVPEGFEDASRLRDVPDTQEVFVNARPTGVRHADGLADQASIVVELLERVVAADDEAALREHVAELVAVDGGHELRFARVQALGGERLACVAEERACKWDKPALEEPVVLCVGLVRLADVATDAVITVHVPGAVVGDGAALPPAIEAAYALLLRMVREFTVVDKTLFK